MPPRKAQSQPIKETKLTAAELKKIADKRWGPGTFRFASDPSLRIERIPCGIAAVDWAMGGGFPRNRYTELYGSYSVGKTLLTYNLIANSQQKGLSCAFIDVERTFDSTFAAHQGVDLDKLAYEEQDESGNRVIDFMEMLLRSGLYDVIVMDSIAALLPSDEKEKAIEATTYGTAQAKLMSLALRKLTAANRRTSLVFINQLREAIGVVFGNKNVTSGGRAMSFYAGMRLELVKTETIKGKARRVNVKTGEKKIVDVNVGHRVLLRVVKDKTGPQQYSESTFVFNAQDGRIDFIEDVIFMGRVFGLIHKQGDYWYVEGYESEKQNGRPGFKKWLAKEMIVTEELQEKIAEKVYEQEEE